MNFAAFFFWFLEFALEVSGAVRSRNILLKATFGYLAAADIACLIASTQPGWDAYIQAYWIVRAGKYMLLCIIAAVICGKMVKSHPCMTALLALVCALGAGCMSALIFSAGASVGERLLDAGISASALLGMVLLVGWADRKKSLTLEWRVIAFGLLVLLAGDALVMIAAKLYWPAHNLKWFPEIIQLAMWNYAAKVGIGEARLPLSPNLIATEEVRGAVQ